MMFVVFVAERKRLSRDLVGLHVEGSRGESGRTLWSLVKIRRAHRCWRCGDDLPSGAKAFSPIGNMKYRYQRICVPCIDLEVPWVAPSEGAE